MFSKNRNKKDRQESIGNVCESKESREFGMQQILIPWFFVESEIVFVMLLIR